MCFPKQVRSSRGKFIDSLRIYVRGGAGGMGFPKYGGIGGKGGSVIVVAKEGEWVCLFKSVFSFSLIPISCCHMVMLIYWVTI